VDDCVAVFLSALEFIEVAQPISDLRGELRVVALIYGTEASTSERKMRDRSGGMGDMKGKGEMKGEMR